MSRSLLPFLGLLPRLSHLRCLSLLLLLLGVVVEIIQVVVKVVISE